MNDAPSWRTPRIFLILALVFLAGSVAGSVAMRFQLPAMIYKPMPYWSEGGKKISLQKFKRDLDLTDEQARQVENELDDFVKYYQTLQAQMDEVRGAGRDRILRILNPEQQRRFHAMLNELTAKQIR
jgi:Spy/CpxP family protein refolding chaperone